ncbi:Protein phosphatase 1 regulatory inhibitor subunit 16B [Schistosoma japonicum]|uniref:Protein phosphatase 1 regulatory inhibitor subunit 16B n=1 Tax=Schistosoma japonicum TaxID=6182 RepID=A0A4Z2DRQ0_SCHJA|nr:Protein phosphatase 1 regulatory inhibitor subunit 16B [Schistosoma japonicum]
MNNLHNGSSALDVKRIEAARANRQLQLENWRDYERQMLIAEKNAKKSYSRESHYACVKFTDNCVLLDATLRGDFEEVEYLLSHGIDPNISNVDGLTALHQACIDNDSALCNLLLNYGANVNARDADLWTPLHAASTCGYLQICQLLIKRGADLKACNADGLIPYDICDDEKTSDFLQSQMHKLGISPLEIEEARSEPEMKMLSDLKTAHAKRYDLNILDSQGAAPIHVAAACGYCEVGLYLLQSGVNPNSLDADGWTPSHIAACWGELEMIKLLVSHGGDLTIPTPDGRTAFTICDNNETHDEVCAIWNMREKLRSSVKLVDSNCSIKPFRRRRSGSLIHRSSLRDKSNLSRREAKEEAQFAHLSPISLTDVPSVYEKYDQTQNENHDFIVGDRHTFHTLYGVKNSTSSVSPKSRKQKSHIPNQINDIKRDSRLPILLNSDDCEYKRDFTHTVDNTFHHSEQGHPKTQNNFFNQREITILSADETNSKTKYSNGRTTIIDKRANIRSVCSSNDSNSTTQSNNLKYPTNTEVHLNNKNHPYQNPSFNDLSLPQYIDQERITDYSQHTLIRQECCRKCTIL